MISPAELVAAFAAVGVTRYSGVPDSLLKSFCAYLADSRTVLHVPAANEGSAIGLAIGWYLGTGRPGVIYLQNSGLGNTVNPLTSLAHSDVYGVPIVLIIGWRGEMVDGAQIADEPQHKVQGRITEDQLRLLGIPYEILSKSSGDATKIATDLAALAVQSRGPVALLVRKDAFAPYERSTKDPALGTMSREDAIVAIAQALPPDARVVSTTGMASRELFEARTARNQGHGKDFLTVGGMGHASQIAAGLAQARPDRSVICIDGDGAMMMHTGALATVAGVPNLVHVVINNGRHDSVGGQLTAGAKLDLPTMARSLGYARVSSTDTVDGLTREVATAIGSGAASFIEVRCRPGARSDLGRPTSTPRDNIQSFMEGLDRP